MPNVLHIAALLLAPGLCLGQSGKELEGEKGVGSSSTPVVRDLSPEQLEQLRSTQEVFIYDCNEADNYEWSHVPGAVLTVYDELTKEKLPADMNATLVFYCYSPECPAGATAAKTALSFGYVNVYHMPAGIVGWEDAGMPTEPKP